MDPRETTALRLLVRRPPPPSLVPLRLAAELAGVDPGAVADAVRRGTLESVKIKATPYVSIDELEALFAERN
jgi:hypothetical protein